MSRTFSAALVALLLALAPPTGHATRLVALDLPALVRDSREIVVGRVASTRSHWNERHTKIVTDVVVAVEEALKGADDGDGTVTLTQLGGTVDGARYSVPGSPAFRVGEEALLFVWRDPAGRAQVNGFAQGKFDIRTDAATGERLVQRTLPGLAVKDLRSLAPASGTQAAPSFRLTELKATIARELAAQDGAAR